MSKLQSGILASILVAVALDAHAAQTEWQTTLHFDHRSASASVDGNTYLLDSNGTKHKIPRQAAFTETASPLFDALFALTQIEADDARVKQLVDGAYNHGKPIPCDCYVTGVKWPFVWTRDSAYSVDLALAERDPARARRTLEFKLSSLRIPENASHDAANSSDAGLYVVQDTGSGGSWPISTDRVAWFLGARNLLADQPFSDKVYKALNDTLAQDRRFAFDVNFGLYRGETSFLDWREQTYPIWTKTDVRYIAESFALSTNVLHYDALRLAQDMSDTRGDTAATARYKTWADALKGAIDRNFWRDDRGLYMSYIGNSAGKPQAIDSYDLLGVSLAILSGVAEGDHARRALANYPTWPAGSPVIWPERRDVAIYHNRAIWPFVSAYALKAARKLDDPSRIAHELKSTLRGAVLSGSNMENYEFLSQAVHVEDGANSGPVVNSPRQLWSVAASLNLVREGVFGLTAATEPEPKLPAELVPMLFGERSEIRLTTPERIVVLRRPANLGADDNLLVADSVKQQGKETIVMLRGRHVDALPLRLDAPVYAPTAPTGSPLTPMPADAGGLPLRLFDNNRLMASWPTPRATAREAAKPSGAELPNWPSLQVLWTTRIDPMTNLESLPGPIAFVAEFDVVSGAWPRHWNASRDGRQQLRIKYSNPHGPINTGVTAAVKMLTVRCADSVEQSAPIVMPHSVGEQISTAAIFQARKGQSCSFSLDQGFNMSFLARNALFTGGQGGASGALNEASVGDLQIAPLD